MHRLLILLAVALPLLPNLADAQSRPAQPAPVPAAPPAATPDRTSAQFGDWTVRCEAARGAPAAPARNCEMAQTLADPRGQPVAQIVFGRLSRTAPWRLLVQLPLEARVEQPVRLFAEATEGVPVPLPFRSCSLARGGCFADAELPDEVVPRRLRAQPEGQGRIEFQDAAGRATQATFSLRGFGAALDALARSE